MKRILMTVAAITMLTAAATAQNYMVIDSEKVFKSIAAYNTAISELDKLADTYQQQVDAKYKDVESLYNDYISQKSSLTYGQQQTVENAILAREDEAARLQESLFGTDGTLMKKRVELIQPIQERVFKAIETYAAAEGFDLVLDKASNPNILYSSSAIDRTQAVIDILKKQ